MPLRRLVDLAQSPPELPFLLMGTLLRRNGVSLADPAWRELFLRHGTADLLAAFEHILRHE